MNIALLSVSLVPECFHEQTVDFGHDTFSPISFFLSFWCVC